MENEGASQDVAEVRTEVDQLREEHRALEKRLDELNDHVYLTPAEQAEERRIKKLKLRRKDRIHQLERVLAASD